ncbi:hypothetical protein GNI_209790 [Gregarina niphandrodes]|uniref:Uncharacterized protein n=1 Tax=Gregarina niphandrodes TaxID=110365 RepID=A0A023AWW5_GRENI|nr:hypothetical protein GNI_209790 [Gregarina niphandrodes]EZG42903.1 hypothetical protein GNI_209790 [Gregarina niphandrodes]|eukprot:XP_011133822.1 hypothetical protein GNI_209790 [Gregarina niphandrodes]
MSLSLWAQALPVLIEFAPALFGVGAAGTAIGTGLQVANAVNSLLSGGDFSKQSTVDTLVNYVADTATDALIDAGNGLLRQGVERAQEAYRDRLRPRAKSSVRKPSKPPQKKAKPFEGKHWVARKKRFRSRAQPF